MKPKEAAEWINAHRFLKDAKGVPYFLADFVDKKQRAALRLVNVPKSSGLPAWADALKLRASLERKLEAACKAIVKRRDLTPDGWGNCISCKANSNRLQWGHFVPQHKSEWLRFDPRNTAMQCADCNGFGGGMTFEYGKAINEREKDPTFADRLVAEAKRYHTWKPSLKDLEKKLEELESQINPRPAVQGE